MPFDAGGVFQRLYSWLSDRDAGIKILAERMDNETDGIVDAINDIVEGDRPWKGPMKGLDGTAAAPSWTFANDPDSGLFRKSNGSIGVSVDGVEVGDFPASFFTGIADHHAATNNPHGVTAAQLGVLPLTGGALSGGLIVNGDLLAGGSTTNHQDGDTQEQFCYTNGGFLAVSRQGAPTAYFNRQGTDGDIVGLRRGGSTIGAIGGRDTQIYIGTPTKTGLDFAGSILPRHNGALNNGTDVDLGSSGYRFKDVYLSGGAYLGGTALGNLLDHYEEGTWTPNLNYSTSVVYTDQQGWYVRIGKLVFCRFDISISSKGADNSQVHLSLPFTGDAGFRGVSGSIDYYLSSLVPSSLVAFGPANHSQDSCRFNGQGGMHSYDSLNGSGRLVGGFVYQAA